MSQLVPKKNKIDPVSTVHPKINRVNWIDMGSVGADMVTALDDCIA